MKYIVGNTTKFRWTHDYNVWLIDNHTLPLVGETTITLVLEGKGELAVILLDNDGRKLLADTLRALPPYYIRLRTIKLDDTTSLGLEPHEGYVVLSIRGVVTSMETEDVNTLVSILERPALIEDIP